MTILIQMKGTDENRHDKGEVQMLQILWKKLMNIINFL